MQQSRNMLHGKGLSITKYFTHDIDNPIYDLTPYWPPGYPVLLAPFLKIFNYDIFWSNTSIDLVFAVAFILIVRKIVLELGFPVVAANIITLITGCFDYPFISKSLPTDIPAFVFFLIGLLLLIRNIKSEDFRLFHLLIVSVFLFLPCTFRYSYPPLSIAVPLAIIFSGWYIKKNLFIKKGVVVLSAVSVLTIVFFILLKNLTGSAAYIVDTGRGFFPENLFYWAPFVTESFINMIFTMSQLRHKTGISLAQILQLLNVINAIMFVCLVALFANLFFRKKFFKINTLLSVFLVIGLFVSVATFVSLGYLSVTYKPQPRWGNYIGESRYFMFVNLFLQIAFIGWVFLYPSWKNNIFQKIIVVCVSALLFIEVTHNIYFHTKVAANPAKHVAPGEQPDYISFISIMKSLKTEEPNADVWVVSDNDEFFPLMTNYLGQKGVYDGNKLLTTLPAVKKMTVLILALYDMEMDGYRSFLTEQKAKFLNRVNYVNFYRVDIYP